MRKILLSGAYGQVGQQLYPVLCKRYGIDNVVCTDLKFPPKSLKVKHHEILDVHNRENLFDLLKKYEITDFYSLAALLSATGERYPMYTEKINMGSLFNSLEAARQGLCKRVFWPSSIAAFGNNTPKRSPQHTIQQPTTVYGITKKAGELWCNYYYNRYGVDVRSVRYPGLVGWRSNPGGGTTDYAPQMLQAAVMGEKYQCYLNEDTPLSMMYMEDAVNATIQLMEANPDKLTIRTSYNIQAMHFTPMEIEAAIKKRVPEFAMGYEVDEVRQFIAESWPNFFVDEKARRDWGWAPKYNMEDMVEEILTHLTPEFVRSIRPQ